MKNPIEKIEDLKCGKLDKIMAYYIENEEDQKESIEKIKTPKGKYATLLNDFESLYGYKPVKEFIEIEECLDVYDLSDIVMLEGSIAYVEKYKDKEIDYKDFEMVIMLTGLERLGFYHEGDSCYMNTLPNPMDTAEIYGYDHEMGELNGDVAYSMADFIIDEWKDRKSEKSTGEIKKIIESFHKECTKERQKRPFYYSPEILFKRAHWLLGHASGNPVYKFAEKMSDAPTFKDWENEKELISKVPVIANYWLLAHFFLGNTNACMECIELAKKTPGKITPALAEFIEKALNNFGKKGFKLLGLSANNVKNIIADTQKNASNELFEPEVKKQIEKSRGEDKIKKLSEAEFKDKIKSGSDPMDIINEYPEDVDIHDMALKEIGKNDKDFMNLVEEYFNNRTRDVYTDWPYDKKPDKKFSVPVCAAFCSGLKFDQDNKKSFAGLTKTLGKLDDENSMKAYRKAFQTLNPWDKRLKYIVENLQKSKRPEIREVLISGAWKFFDILKLAKENENALNKKRKNEGPTLDNMFDVENHFLQIVRMVLDWNDEESVKLSDNILKETKIYKTGIFKTTIGRAFRVIGNHKLERHLEYLKWYIKAVGELHGKIDGYIEQNTLFNFTEACIAYTKIAGEKAEQQLKELFGRVTVSKYFDQDIKSGTLGGLLILKPSDEELLDWIKKLLGIRDKNMRIYGALRAVYEATLDETTKEIIKPLVKSHSKSSINEFIPHQIILKETAKETYKKLEEKNLS